MKVGKRANTKVRLINSMRVPLSSSRMGHVKGVKSELLQSADMTGQSPLLDIEVLSKTTENSNPEKERGVK